MISPKKIVITELKSLVTLATFKDNLEATNWCKLHEGSLCGHESSFVQFPTIHIKKRRSLKCDPFSFFNEELIAWKLPRENWPFKSHINGDTS